MSPYVTTSRNRDLQAWPIHEAIEDFDTDLLSFASQQTSNPNDQ